MGVFVVKPNAGHKVYNNVIYNSVSPTSSAIKSQNYDLQWPTGTYPPSEIYNNTFYNLVSHEASGVDPIKLIIRNNIGINLPENLTQGQLSSTHFVNAVGGNLRLTPTSAAIDRATKQPYSSVDIEGRSSTGTARDFARMNLDYHHLDYHHLLNYKLTCRNKWHFVQSQLCSNDWKILRLYAVLPHESGPTVHGDFRSLLLAVHFHVIHSF